MIGRRTILGSGLALGVWLATPPDAGAHPQHDSMARAHIRGGRLEVALRVTPEDLEEALTHAGGKRISLERTKDVDRLIRQYLERHFSVHSGGKRRRLTWVGKEVSVTEAWLYFEIALPGGPAGHRIRNTMFFEVAPTQVNTVQVSRGREGRTLVFRRDDDERAVWPDQQPPGKKEQ